MVQRRQPGAPGMKQLRRLATVTNANPSNRGPLNEYDARVDDGLLRNDEHQRAISSSLQSGIVQSLQHLHDELKEYRAPQIVHPNVESLQSESQSSFLGGLFRRRGSRGSTTNIPKNVPKGLYLFGDVGSGKTMLMDMFYDTLPENITSKTRIHFHNFIQDVHKRLHAMKKEYGVDFDAIPFIGADIAEQGSVLCFDEFQVTDVADAMILRRLLESMMSHGVVLVATSNRHPDDLYKNGIQRNSFIPCINLLKSCLHVINLDSPTDYRKIPRPPSGVYHFPLDKAAASHANNWFKFLGDFEIDPPRTATHRIWGRDVVVPRASGKAAMFEFAELCGRPTSAADYLELMRWYEAFIITEIPGMTHKTRDLARRFITFIDAVYESRAKLVLTTAVPLTELFVSRTEVDDALHEEQRKNSPEGDEHHDVDDSMRHLMDDLGINMQALKNSNIFTGDEERFAFARALSRLNEMGGQQWIERGLGLEKDGGREDMESWQKVRSRWREDML
ncbi:hypothetical protein FGG08_006968 [Glutinoglossum americanum]|uniref:AFG1-like ATPase n=1 Tax=Glutinoglossum americanum TaxID=1670608 RepID=A0A9P8HUX5_9PEZI|nr:hypothetical protein FGG08_006968 [Glutinoglossum americanum]